MADDNQREELNQSLACISDRYSQCEGNFYNYIYLIICLNFVREATSDWLDPLLL